MNVLNWGYLLNLYVCFYSECNPQCNKLLNYVYSYPVVLISTLRSWEYSPAINSPLNEAWKSNLCTTIRVRMNVFYHQLPFIQPHRYFDVQRSYANLKRSLLTKLAKNSKAVLKRRWKYLMFCFLYKKNQKLSKKFLN